MPGKNKEWVHLRRNCLAFHHLPRLRVILQPYGERLPLVRLREAFGKPRVWIP